MSKVSEERREIREMTLETAVEELAKSRRNLFDLRLQQGRGEVKDVREFAKTKKRVARLMYKVHAETHFALDEDAADDEDLSETDAAAEDTTAIADDETTEDEE